MRMGVHALFHDSLPNEGTLNLLVDLLKDALQGMNLVVGIRVDASKLRLMSGASVWPQPQMRCRCGPMLLVLEHPDAAVTASIRRWWQSLVPSHGSSNLNVSLLYGGCIHKFASVDT